MVLSFPCDACGESFASQKSLLLHQQSVHGRRSQMRLFADADGICPVCGVHLHTRLRLLKHLSDKRRPKCRSLVAYMVPPLPLDRVELLDREDRLARAASRGVGLNYVASSSQALRADGKMTGTCRQ